MLDTDMVRTLLDHGAYEACRDRLTPTLFSEDIRDIYSTLAAAHDLYGHDLTTKELFLSWKSNNPVATSAEINNMKELLEDVEAADKLSGDLVSDVVEKLWRRDIGKKVATLGLEISEGRDDAMSDLTRMLEKYSGGFIADDFGDPTTTDLDELLALFRDDHRFKFNIETLARRVYGIGREEFAVIFATPETGKTAFLVSMVFAPGGFLDQGAKVMILGNEESTKRTVVRAYQSLLGMTGEEILADSEKAKVIFKAKTDDKIIFKDTQDWDLDKVDAYIGKHKPDIVILDQLDKVAISGSFEKGHERLRELYRRARETAKRFNCAFIGVSQASDAARGKTRLTYDMMEGSKIGKAAEADLIIGIGKTETNEDEPDNSRYLTVSKNKLSGWHGTVIVEIQPEISRYSE